MPELPEVMRIRQGLVKLKHETINSVEVISGRYVRHGPPKGLDGFKAALPLVVSRVANFGKLLWIRLENEPNDWHILCTLGMSGSLKFNEAKHTRIRFGTSIGDLFFDDIRNFGTIRFIGSEDELNERIRSVGPTVNRIDAGHFADRIRSRDRTISEALMDQKCIAGVGNYIKSEALFEARISPHRQTNEITDEEMGKLFTSIIGIVDRSFNDGGASMRTFSDSQGKKGKFQDRFEVYGRSVSASGIVIRKETTLDKRTTFWCPTVQS